MQKFKNMKLSLFACAILCFSFSFAQLSVRNNAYVFVSDEVLFVNDDVNLEESTAKIYLRDESQLIQGTGTTGNSGLGELSVYQTGTANQWSYNYWCSPVGNTSLANGNEDARVALLNDVIDLENSTPALFTTGYDGSASPLTISTRWLWTYQTSSLYSDWFFVGDAGAIAPGLGFTMKGNGTGVSNNQEYDFRGKPNNGTMSNPIAVGEFTLVGNPYPSAIDSAAFIHDADNVNEIVGTLFYWEQAGYINSHYVADYIGGYHEFTINAAGTIVSNTFAQFETYNSQGISTGIPPGPPGGTKQARRYIPIGQGFMVEGQAGATTNTVSVKNTHRVFEKIGTDSYFFRSSNTNDNNATETTPNTGIQYQENGLSIVPNDYKRFRLNVDFSVNEAQYTRQLLLNFHDTATFGHDRGLELHRSQNLSSDAYFEQENDVYSGLAYPFAQELTIPFVIDIEEQQPLRFRIFDVQNFDESQGIYIHDNENDTYINLRNVDYELNIEPGNYTNRFEIVFTTNSTLGIEDFEATSLTIRQNNDNNELSVLNPNALDIKTIEIFDVAGKRIYNLPYNAVSELYSVSTAAISDGVYVVKVTTNSSTVKSQKIIVKN